jgi:hypothetical protein
MPQREGAKGGRLVFFCPAASPLLSSPLLSSPLLSSPLLSSPLPPSPSPLLSFPAAELTCACSSAYSHVKGLHLNMSFISRNIYSLTPLLGQRFGRFLGYTEKDLELLYPFKEKVFYNIMRESGYLHIQATKPDTVGKHTGAVEPRGNLTAPERTAYSKKPLTRKQKSLFSLLRTEPRHHTV